MRRRPVLPGPALEQLLPAFPRQQPPSGWPSLTAQWAALLALPFPALRLLGEVTVPCFAPVMLPALLMLLRFFPLPACRSSCCVAQVLLLLRAPLPDRLALGAAQALAAALIQSNTVPRAVTSTTGGGECDGSVGQLELVALLLLHLAPSWGCPSAEE